MLCPKDTRILTRQLNHPPWGALDVVARSLDAPSVIKVSPLLRNKPFPTLFWLTCPKLKKKISALEYLGLISKWEQEKELIEELEKDHLRYQKMRMHLFKTLFPRLLLPENKLKILRDTGIGGIQNFAHIKCLHLHYAHFLADSNVVGKRIHHLLKKGDPPPKASP